MRVWVFVVALTFCIVSEAHAQFRWPESDANAIPDARLTADVQAARNDAREGARNARDGEVAAGQARRLVALRISIGRGPQRTTVADGVVVAAVELQGVMKGTMTWETSAILTGDISNMTGVYEPEPESNLSGFRGWMYGASPMTGTFEFRTGDMFSGHYNAGDNASGIFTEAGGERRFVGVIDFEAGEYRPLRGYVEDRRGRLLAVVSVTQ